MAATADNRGRLLWASFLTLIAAGIGFGVRGGVLGNWAAEFGFTNVELGTITGGGLVGFGIVIVLGSLIAEKFSYKSVFVLAFILHIISALVTVAAAPVYAAMGKEATYWCLYIGMFIFAVGNGLCEAVINPLVAALYPKQKTHYMNVLHAGWPGGLIIGGLLAHFMLGSIRWEIPIILFLVPTVMYGVIILKEDVPKSEAGAAGVSFGDMLKEFAAPMLLFLLVLHACIGYVELGTDSWIAKITDSLLTGQGLILFIYASSVMFILRFFAGPIVERINPLGLLCLSSVLGVVGLYLLSISTAAGMIWLAVTIYSFGKTFLWPTMLGVVGERYPRGGALTMGAVGGIGMLSAGFLGGPGIGYNQDTHASDHLKTNAPETYARYAADGENGFLFFPKVKGLNGQKVGVILDKEPGKTLTTDFEIFEKNKKENPDAKNPLTELNTWWTAAKVHAEADKQPVHDARIHGSRMALKITAAIPATMFVGFLILVLYFKSKGGYHAVEIAADGSAHEGAGTPSAQDAIDTGEEGPSSGQA